MSHVKKRLSWALTVASYNRHTILLDCVMRALAQDPRPKEVVVVDASSNWQEGKARAEKICAQAGIPINYISANRPSLAAQRNQAIEAATADILFMIDDDALLFDGAATEIMSIYEADQEGEIAGIQLSIEANPANAKASPDGTMPVERKVQGPSRRLQTSPLGQFLNREIFLMNAERLFIPYHGEYSRKALPQSLRAFDVAQASLFTGCAMTYRRRIIEKVRFEGTLESYCPAEDLDASYRASQAGLLLLSRRAKLDHIEAAAGRIRRRIATCLSATNVAFFVRRNATAKTSASAKYCIMLMRRVLAEFLKDLGSRRFTFPQFIGILQSIPIACRVLTIDENQLVDFYRDAQRGLLFPNSPKARSEKA